LHILHVILQSLSVAPSPVVVAVGLANTVLLASMGICHVFLYTTPGRRQHVWSVVWTGLGMPPAKAADQSAAPHYAPPMPADINREAIATDYPDVVAATVV
jgi:hypothetical protein